MQIVIFSPDKAVIVLYLYYGQSLRYKTRIKIVKKMFHLGKMHLVLGPEHSKAL